jgi:hypothetical protein
MIINRASELTAKNRELNGLLNSVEVRRFEI